jgi:hypothetical protein
MRDLSMETQEEYVCRVCGLLQEEKTWGEDGKTPSFIICYCCGSEPGYEDCQLSSIRSARERWFKKGGIWNAAEIKPTNWSLKEQLAQIPSEYQ